MSLEFKHIPVMSEDIDRILTPYKSGLYIDCTFGGGSITRKILSKKNTKVISIDRDNFVESFSKEISKEYKNRFEFIIDRFSNLEKILIQLFLFLKGFLWGPRCKKESILYSVWPLK